MENDSIDTILDNLCRLQTETLRETRDLIDKETMREAADRIISGKNIVIFSRSPNSYYAGVFTRKLCSIGYFARVAKSGEAGLAATAMGREDCAVIISYSGNNPTKDPVDKIKKRNPASD